MLEPLTYAVADPGEPPTPLFLDQTEARRGLKKFSWKPGSPLSQVLDDRPFPQPPPPHPPSLI